MKSLVLFEIGLCLEHFIAEANQRFVVLVFLLYVSGQVRFPLEHFSTLVALVTVCGGCCMLAM